MKPMNPMDQGNLQNDPAQGALNPNPMNLDENDPNVARDPVCGMLVDKRTARDTITPAVGTQEDTLYFCSADCKQLFEQDPQRYGYTNF
jgi:YHS domain-containing protein